MFRTILGVMLLSLVLAVFISPFASGFPDGLERVAHELGFLEAGAEKVVMESPIPDYLMPGVANEQIATAAAGLVGTALAFGVIYGVGKLITLSKKEAAEG